MYVLHTAHFLQLVGKILFSKFCVLKQCLFSSLLGQLSTVLQSTINISTSTDCTIYCHSVAMHMYVKFMNVHNTSDPLPNGLERPLNFARRHSNLPGSCDSWLVGYVVEPMTYLF